MQIFCLFFASFALFFANLAIRSPQGSKRLRNARTFVQAKHLDHINKSTFYIRLSALRRSGYSFFPMLRFATHWAELMRPCGAVTAVSRQFRIPPWKGGKGDVHIGIMTGEHRGLPLHELPFPLPCHSEHFPCHSERQR